MQGGDSASSAPPGVAETIRCHVLFSGLTAQATLHGSIEEQMSEALGRLDDCLAASGTDRRSLLTVHIWLRDMAFFDRMTAVWNDWISSCSDAPPSRSCVSGGSLSPEALDSLVALDASAARPSPDATPAAIQRYGLVSSPTMCLALAYDDWFTVCTLASDGSADIAGQTAQILATFDSYLAEAGVDRSDILTMDIWLKRMPDDAVVRDLLEKWLGPAEWPPGSCVRADMSREDKLVEIRITARRPAPAM
eukprot:COSAG02_NODE_8462_length_2564_cov_2.818661_2_plen_250_part_00